MPPLRVGTTIFAAAALGFLLPAAEGAESAATQRVAPQAQEPAADAMTAYVGLTRRSLALERERRSAELALALARRSLTRSQRRLAARLRLLYVQGRPNPLEVVLDARSFDDAIGSLESLERIGREEAEQVQALRRARENLERLVRRLRVQEKQAAVLREQATTVMRTLAARRLQSAAPPKGEPPVPSSPAPLEPDSAHTLTVVALGYSMTGATATGLPAGMGTVAVDPGLIPLGTALTIPGYGQGVAADTGAAIRGAVIDLWFPTADQARAWGRRAVTIELHPR